MGSAELSEFCVHCQMVQPMRQVSKSSGVATVCCTCGAQADFFYAYDFEDYGDDDATI